MLATDSPFYRVSLKALIFDEQRRLLVFQDKAGDWEIPGGGFEHGESVQACIARELYEEMRIIPEEIGKIRFMYTGKHKKNYHKLCLAVPVSIRPGDFVPTDDDLVAARYVTRDEFLQLPFGPNERTVLECVDQIWP